MVLRLAAALVAARGTRLAFTGIGAEAIAWELAHRGWQRVPALWTIDRILQHHGRTGRQPPTHEGGREPYPAPPAHHPGDVQQTDLVGPRHLRGPQGPIRFYSFHTIDVVAHTPVTSQYRTKGTPALNAHLLAAWRRLGLPRCWQTDNEMVASGRPPGVPGAFTQATRLALLLGIDPPASRSRAIAMRGGGCACPWPAAASASFAGSRPMAASRRVARSSSSVGGSPPNTSPRPTSRTAAAS